MGPTIEVSPHGFFDSAPLLIKKNPNLKKLFLHPPIIQKPTAQNRKYWASADEKTRRITLVTGYLQHPNPEVRLKTLNLYVEHELLGHNDQLLFDLLAADPNEAVRREAAKVTWLNEKEVNCKYTVDKAKDEIAYGSENHPVGPTRAKTALTLLLETAPDDKAHQALETLMTKRIKHLRR